MLLWFHFQWKQYSNRDSTSFTTRLITLHSLGRVNPIFPIIYNQSGVIYRQGDWLNNNKLLHSMKRFENPCRRDFHDHHFEISQ